MVRKMRKPRSPAVRPPIRGGVKGYEPFSIDDPNLVIYGPSPGPGQKATVITGRAAKEAAINKAKKDREDKELEEDAEE